MNHSIPMEIQNLLNLYVESLVSEFGDAIFGVYIYGSLASGCFDMETSDIDFMTIIKKDLDEEEIKRIQSIHNKLIESSKYGKILEGEYVSLNDITNGMPKKQYPYFAFGKFQGFVKLKNFAWFQLSEKGINYYGTEFNSIAGNIDWKDVKKELLERLNQYWPSVVNWRLIVSDKWIPLVVLSVCRVYYSLENKSTISKVGGGEYALTKLPTEWHPLIHEALRIHKKSQGKSLFKTRTERLKRVKEFVKFVSEATNSYYAYI